MFISTKTIFPNKATFVGTGGQDMDTPFGSTIQPQGPRARHQESHLHTPGHWLAGAQGDAMILTDLMLEPCVQRADVSSTCVSRAKDPEPVGTQDATRNRHPGASLGLEAHQAHAERLAGQPFPTRLQRSVNSTFSQNVLLASPLPNPPA